MRLGIQRAGVLDGIGTVALLFAASCGEQVLSASVLVPQDAGAIEWEDARAIQRVDSGSSSRKKGVLSWYFAANDRPLEGAALSELGVSWFHNLGTNDNNDDTPTGVEYVPRIAHVSDVTASKLAEAKDQGTILLSFGNPSKDSVSPEQALSVWPELEKTGMRLGSPVSQGNPSGQNTWLAQFMDGAKASGYRVDFICVTFWYGEFDTALALTQLERLARETHEKYQLPVWVLDYSLVRWSSPAVYPTWEQQSTFARESVALLESLPFVERYSWYLLPPLDIENGATNYLYDAEGNITPVGIAYRDAKGKQ